MAQAMSGVTKAMQSMNRQLNLPQIQKILHEFEKQSEIMDMKEEMINEHIDDAMEDEGDEEESDAVVSQVLDELGLQLGDQLSGLPQVRVGDFSLSQVDSLSFTKWYDFRCRHLDHCRLQLAANSLKRQLWEPEVVVLVVAVVAVEAELRLQCQMPMLIYKLV